MHVGLEGSEFVGGKPKEMPSISLGKVENKDHFTVIGERYSSSRLHDDRGRRGHMAYGLARGSRGDDVVGCCLVVGEGQLIIHRGWSCLSPELK